MSNYVTDYSADMTVNVENWNYWRLSSWDGIDPQNVSNAAKTGMTVTLGTQANPIVEDLWIISANYSDPAFFTNGFVITLNGDIFKTYSLDILPFGFNYPTWDKRHKIKKPKSVNDPTLTQGYEEKSIYVRFVGWFYLLNNGGRTQFYPVFLEETRKVGACTWSNATVVSTYEPKQTINLTLSVDCEMSYREFSTKEIGGLQSSTSPRTKNIYTSYNAPGTYTLATVYSPDVDSFANRSYSWNVTITDWANKQYSIEQISGTTFDLYAGQEVDNAFLNAHKVKYRKWNSYGEEVSYPKPSLEADDMSATIFSNSATTLVFNYDISTITETSTTSISYTVPTAYVHHLKSSGWNANLQRKQVFYLGDDIEDVDFSSAGSLVYDDDTTISMQDVNITSQTTVCTMNGNAVVLPMTVGLGTPNSFTMSYTIVTDYFGTLTFQDSCSTASSAQLKAVVLSGEKHVFNPNEVIGFGDSAQIQLIAQDNSVIETISSANIMSRITNVDAKYGSYARDYLQDGKVTLTFTCEGVAMTHEICFCYDELTLSLNTSGVTTSYIVDQSNNNFAFDYTNLVVKKTTHTNAYSSGTVTTTISETTLTSSQYTISANPSAINYSQDQTYTITVSCTNSWAQIASGTFTVYTTPLAITGILVTGSGDSIEYWDNGVDTFKLPEDLTFTVTYNDSSKNTTVSYEDLDYFIDSDMQIQISEGSTLSSSNLETPNTIYFYSEDYDYGGSFSIHFNVDPITSVALHSSISVFLGNKLNKESVKQQVTLDCTHASTNVTQITDPNAYSFKNTDTITAIPVGNLVVTIVGTGDKEISNTSTMVSWNKPYAKLTIDNTNFQTSYNNTVDVIDPSTITAKVEFYEDALYATKCDYEIACAYSSTATNAYNKFIVVGNVDLSGYAFGVDVLNINMNGQSQKSVSFDLKVKNMFYDSQDQNQPQYVTEYVTGTETVSVLEILDITGIKLISAKREYVVGEKFLNNNDDTRIRVYYNDANSNPRTYECYLRAGLTALNIYPTPGTEFKNVVNDKIVTVTSASDYNVSVQYSVDVKPNFVYNENATHKLVAVYLKDYVCPDGVARTKYFLVGRTAVVGSEEKDSTVIGSTGRVLNSGVSASNLHVYGYLDNVNDPTKNAIVILFNDYVPPMDGSNNVSVKFPCYVSGNADLINKCHFGVMFGNNNSKNRLFVSGNKDYKNKDWHTGQVDTTQTTDETMINGNYGYFEDLSECVYGETDNAVVGYDIVSTDKLLVLKDYSDKETTIYFRQPQLVTAINNSGTAVTGLDDETLYQEEFSLSKGNNSVAGINPYAVANFNGDSLFISNEKQVVGLDLTGIIGDNQRYANSRSHYIDADLKNYDLSKAFLWTNNKYLFVVLPTKIYVAHYQMKNDETKQYEWFIIDVSNVSSIIEIDDVMYFGTHNGELFKFSEEYRDARKIFVGYGVVKLTVNASTELITASNYLADLDVENKKYYFRPVPFANLVGDYIYYSLGTVANSNSYDCDFLVITASGSPDVIELVCNKDGVTDIERRELLLNRIKEGIPVYFAGYDSSVSNIECADGSELASAWGKPYFLKEYDSALHHYYQVIDENGAVVPVKQLYRARLCMRITEDTEMTEIDPKNGTFRLKSEGEVLDIYQYNNQSMSAFRGEVIEYSNVEAFYITHPETMGTLEQLKTVWSFTVTSDSNTPSELDLCYVTNKIPSEKFKTLSEIARDEVLAYIALSKAQKGLTFADFNFTKVDFDKDIVPRTYTHKRVLSGVKFICFAFKNYNDTNSVLGSMTVTYTLPFPSYGGD